MRITVNRRRRKSGAILAVALVVSATVIWQASFSAFMVTTTNPNDSWASGSIALDHQNPATNGTMAATALFTLTNIQPSATTTTKCVKVVYTGNIATSTVIKMYATNVSNTAATNGHQLADYIHLEIDESDGSNEATDLACTGFVASHNVFDGSLMNFTTNNISFATGAASNWTPSATVYTSKTFRIRTTFPGSASYAPGGGATGNATDTDVMSHTAANRFVWELQSA